MKYWTSYVMRNKSRKQTSQGFHSLVTQWVASLYELLYPGWNIWNTCSSHTLVCQVLTLGILFISQHSLRLDFGLCRSSQKHLAWRSFRWRTMKILRKHSCTISVSSQDLLGSRTCSCFQAYRTTMFNLTPLESRSSKTQRSLTRRLQQSIWKWCITW